MPLSPSEYASILALHSQPLALRICKGTQLLNGMPGRLQIALYTVLYCSQCRDLRLATRRDSLWF